MKTFHLYTNYQVVSKGSPGFYVILQIAFLHFLACPFLTCLLVFLLIPSSMQGASGWPGSPFPLATFPCCAFLKSDISLLEEDIVDLLIQLVFIVLETLHFLTRSYSHCQHYSVNIDGLQWSASERFCPSMYLSYLLFCEWLLLALLSFFPVMSPSYSFQARVIMASVWLCMVISNLSFVPCAINGFCWVECNSKFVCWGHFCLGHGCCLVWVWLTVKSWWLWSCVMTFSEVQGFRPPILVYIFRVPWLAPNLPNFLWDSNWKGT